MLQTLNVKLLSVLQTLNVKVQSQALIWLVPAKHSIGLVQAKGCHKCAIRHVCSNLGVKSLEQRHVLAPLCWSKP